MCHDGSKTRDLPALKLHKGGEEETTPVQDNAAQVFRGMIFWLMMLGLNVALVNEVEWRDSKVCKVLPSPRRQSTNLIP